ncbi:hypothetical protein HanPI659440_Chr02g0082751 [Helianthus annuus]|nr:hypothetical protein HanPI659440_Chr02g0082751 [Helianthus annuus]
MFWKHLDRENRYFWIDLSAGLVDYGPALSADGVLPKGEFHPLTVVHRRVKSQKGLIWSAYKVLLVPSLRIHVGFENQLVVQFIHVHGVEKDYKGLDFSETEKSFVDEGKHSGLLFGDQEPRYYMSVKEFVGHYRGMKRKEHF